MVAMCNKQIILNILKYGRKFAVIMKLHHLYEHLLLSNLEPSSIMKARPLQELYCRFEVWRTLRAAKDERHTWRKLFLSPPHGWIHG